MKKIQAVFSPQRWQMEDISDSVTLAIAPDITKNYSTIKEIILCTVNLPANVDKFETFMNICFASQITFDTFQCQPTAITSNVTFLEHNQRIKMFNFNEISSDQQAKIQNKLSKLKFMYNIQPNYLHFEIPGMAQYKFLWNSTYGFYAGENGIKYDKFLKENPSLTAPSLLPPLPISPSTPNLDAATAMATALSLEAPAPAVNTTQQAQLTDTFKQAEQFLDHVQFQKSRQAQDNIKQIKAICQGIKFDPQVILRRHQAKTAWLNTELAYLVLALSGCILVSDTQNVEAIDSNEENSDEQD